MKISPYIAVYSKIFKNARLRRAFLFFSSSFHLFPESQIFFTALPVYSYIRDLQIIYICDFCI